MSLIVFFAFASFVRKMRDDYGYEFVSTDDLASQARAVLVLVTLAVWDTFALVGMFRPWP